MTEDDYIIVTTLERMRQAATILGVVCTTHDCLQGIFDVEEWRRVNSKIQSWIDALQETMPELEESE